MKRVILGTAGHIDHGKTQLVRALTGIDTDRLKEEKQRGISIELGFAFLELGPEIRMGIVDVPGHEKFVRQMVAGSGGIDIAALIVALDEGVMPQTVEHLDILNLLDVRMGLVVLTKSDLVDEELALLVEEDARDSVKGTFLENAPFVKVSSKTGDGLDNLRAVLTDMATKITEKPVHGLMRLPVDRVFTLKGHGTIVTGTLISGTLSVGDEIEILPSGLKTTVRSLESHNRQEEKAFPGERVAVNLRGLEQGHVHRGEVLTHPGQFKPSYIVDVKLRSLARSPIPLSNRRKVRFHHYTSEVEARIILPDMDVLEPGHEVLAQLRASEPVVPAAGDRFVVRALSPSITLGGGVVMNPRAAKLRARSAKTFLELDRGDDVSIIISLVRSAGIMGIGRNELLGLSGFPVKRLDKTLETLRNSRTIIRFDPTENRMVHKDFFEIVRTRVLKRLTAFHAEHPLKEGMSKQEVRSSLPGPEKLIKAVMDFLVSKGEMADEGNLLRLSAHKVQLNENEKDIKDRIAALIVDAGNAPPIFKEVVAAAKVDQKQTRNLMSILEREGRVVRISEDFYFSKDFVEDIKRKLTDFIKREGGITPSQFAEITKSSRKFNIPLLEYLDRQRFTMRVGDQRVLRGSGSSGEGGKVE
jgi:selenocysteine-specific elongation factor